MDIHDRFINEPTSHVTFIYQVQTIHSKAYWSDVITSLVTDFNEYVRTGCPNDEYPRVVETLRTILCFFYQDKSTCGVKRTTAVYSIYTEHFKAINIDDVQKLLNATTLNKKALSLLLDIIILYMTLYCDVSKVVEKFKVMQESINLNCVQENNAKLLNIMIMDCFLDSLVLHRTISSFDEIAVDALVTVVLENMKFWLTLNNRAERQLLTSLLPKVIKVTNQREILCELWSVSLMKVHGTSKSLSMLCSMADVWFPMELECNPQLIQSAMEERFWLLLKDGLLQSSPQHRNQTLYLLQRVAEFLKNHQTSDLRQTEYKEITPLVCSGIDSLRVKFQSSVNNLYLLLQVLEEKQKHLVMPVLPLVNNLLSESEEHSNCNNCFHIAWVRCVFIRILQHDNNAIVEWGLLNAFKANLALYNDEFIDVILIALNNTFLYESDTSETQPAIAKQLAQLLINAEKNASDLNARLIRAAPNISWGPVALFYFIHALSMVRDISVPWRHNELQALRSLVDINLGMYCRILRLGSQIELLNVLANFVRDKCINLTELANTLSAFPSNEAMRRGCLAWQHICKWLSEVITDQEVIKFVEITCEQMKNENCFMDINIKSFAMIIVLFHDARLALTSKKCPAATAIRAVLDNLIKADLRLYANKELSNRSIELIAHLLSFASSGNCVVIHQMMSSYADATLRMILKDLKKLSENNSVEHIDIHVVALEQFFINENVVISKRELINHMEKFEAETHSILDDKVYSNNIQKLFGVKILRECLKGLGTKYNKFVGPLYINYRIPLTQSPEATEDTYRMCNQDRNLRGKIASEYYKTIAEIFHDLVKSEGTNNIDWLEHASYLIQAGGKDIFVPVVKILAQLFHRNEIKSTELDDFVSILRLCWKSTLEYKDCRSAVEELVNLMYDSAFIQCKETNKFVIECTAEMIEKGKKIPDLHFLLVTGLSRIGSQDMFHFHEALVSCLLYGDVPRRDQKIEVQARSHIVDCYGNEYSISIESVNIFAATRAKAVASLHKIISEEPRHAAELLPIVLSKDDQKNKRYYANSYVHRVKHRIMQILMILQPALLDNEIKLVHKHIRNNMLTESNQPSIRIMQEWLLTRIYLQNAELLSDIWTLFDQGYKQRPSSLCSVISIVYHVTVLLSNTNNVQEEFILEAMSHIMPCCVSQQFSVRLYAQVIASKLCSLAKTMSYVSVTNKYQELYVLLTKSLMHGNYMKNISRVQDDFYFTIFHPIKNYTIQTLWHELPRLTNVSSDEYISPDVFQQCSFVKSNFNPLELWNPNQDITNVEVSAHMTSISGNSAPIADDVEANADGYNDMQKKFIPWKAMMQNEHELEEISEILLSRRQALTDDDNIILVASLVDKIPNLGGLSRTSEILGVKELAISSLKLTEDKGFQSLSVSAERLIPIVEVKPHQLRQYLLEKRDDGYTLIGAEQTVNSTNLMDMKFDKKTVLVLGNEKAGIPADLIPLLDQCVEIPQVGVVRSLNVHVTGAICLWEYFKQHHST